MTNKNTSNGEILDTKITKKPPILFYGHPKFLYKIYPRIELEISKEPFFLATKYKAIALLNCGNWDDSDFEFGIIDDDDASNKLFYIKEMYDGALDKVFNNKKGYLYSFSSKNFFKTKNLVAFEYVSAFQPTILKTKKIENLLIELKKVECFLIKYNDEIV